MSVAFGFDFGRGGGPPAGGGSRGLDRMRRHESPHPLEPGQPGVPARKTTPDRFLPHLHGGHDGRAGARGVLGRLDRLFGLSGDARESSRDAGSGSSGPDQAMVRSPEGASGRRPAPTARLLLAWLDECHAGTGDLLFLTQGGGLLSTDAAADL